MEHTKLILTIASIVGLLIGLGSLLDRLPVVETKMPVNLVLRTSLFCVGLLSVMLGVFLSANSGSGIQFAAGFLLVSGVQVALWSIGVTLEILNNNHPHVRSRSDVKQRTR